MEAGPLADEKKRVLIVEDDGIVSMMLQRSLLRLGYQPEGPVPSGEEAIEFCRQHRLDLLVMDIGLSGTVDGIEAVKQIHQEQDIPVIYLTALTDTRTMTRAQQTNPQAYLAKPFDSSGLKACVELALYKHQVECQLRESEARYRLLFENTPIATGIFSLDGTPIAINPAAERLYGYTLEELRQADGARVGYAHPEERSKLVEHLLQKGQLRDLPVEMRRKDGSTFHVLVNIDLMQSGEQKVMLTTVREIPAQGEAASFTHPWQEMVEASRDIFVLVSLQPTLRLEYVSPAIEALSGYSVQEMLGNPLRPGYFFDPADLERNLSLLVQAAENPEPVILKMIHKNGHPVWIEIRGTLQRDPAGEAVAFQGIVQDVTRRVQAEQSLRQSEAMFKNLLEQSGEAISLVSPEEGRILLANRCAREMLGYTLEELQDITAFDIDPTPRDPVLRQQQLERLRKERQYHIETTMKRKDGSMVMVDLGFTLVEHLGQPAILSIAHDITEHKKNEQRLQEALAEREALLHEIHHRVNTNLAMIAGLLELQAEAVDDPAAAHAFEASSHRMHAIAQVHEELYASPLLTRINFRLYLDHMAKRLIGAVPHLPPIQVNVNAEEVFLGLETAVPLGLVANELVFNALEYAYPENQGGEVWLGFKRMPQQAGSPPSLELEVRDRGAGSVPGANPLDGRSAGLQLVQLLARQVQGKLQISQEDGVRVSLIFPEAG